MLLLQVHVCLRLQLVVGVMVDRGVAAPQERGIGCLLLLLRQKQVVGIGGGPHGGPGAEISRRLQVWMDAACRDVGRRGVL